MRPPCIKCGCLHFKTEYKTFTTIGDDVLVTEWLQVTCRECGYQFSEPCKDKKEQGSEETRAN